MRYRIWIAVVGLLCLIGCGGQPQQATEEVEPVVKVGWQAVMPDAMTDAQKTQHEHGLTATSAFAAEMMGELMAAMDAGGPAEGITVCGSKAPAIAAQVSRVYGIEIGRTSHKLRNPDNRAPEWAAALVDELADSPTYLEGPDGELGLLLPIRLKAECQMCHGPRDQIDEAVLETIAENYPEDKAVDFAEGDLRGWFWIEVPASREAVGL